MAMVGLSLPIWRSKLRAGVAEAEAMRDMSQAELQAMTRMVEGQAAAAMNELQATTEQQTAIRDNVLPRARVALDPALAGYASGRLPLVSVIEAIQALWSVQTDAIDADIRAGLAWTRLGRAIGSYEVLEP
jgi:outer membrane protein TolC